MLHIHRHSQFTCLAGITLVPCCLFLLEVNFVVTDFCRSMRNLRGVLIPDHFMDFVTIGTKCAANPDSVAAVVCNLAYVYATPEDGPERRKM